MRSRGFLGLCVVLSGSNRCPEALVWFLGSCGLCWGNIVVLVLFYRRSGLVLVLVDIFEFLRRKKDRVEL